jgi:hypothetical protein
MLKIEHLPSTVTAAEDVPTLLRYDDELEVKAVDLDRRAKEGA